VSEPSASIIIPVYNQLDYTLTCLHSIRKAKDRTPYEIIVVDDYSTDATAETISKMPDVNYIRNETNLGFLKSINVGADKARGEYLMLLNNDTEVKDGYLDSLTQIFREHADAAVAGSMLLYPNGSLQEAGAHMFSDGTAFNYGRGQSPDDYRFSYVRKVDYCSGAAILIKKEIFFALGKFDELFCPAYCEDSDFQLRAAESGYACYYQPLSVVIHHEGVSHGRVTREDSSSNAYQRENTRKLVKRHRERLADRAYPPGTWQDIAIFPRGTRHIYVVADHLLTQDHGGRDARTFEVIKELQNDVQVTLIPLDACYQFSEEDFMRFYDATAQLGVRIFLHRGGDPRVPVRRLIRQFEDQPECVILAGAAAACHFQQATLRWRAKGVRVILDAGPEEQSDGDDVRRAIETYLFGQVNEVRQEDYALTSVFKPF